MSTKLPKSKIKNGSIFLVFMFLSKFYTDYSFFVGFKGRKKGQKKWNAGMQRERVDGVVSNKW